MQREIVLKIKVGKVEREFKVKFPKVGQYIKVESRKAQLSVPNGNVFDRSSQYNNLFRNGMLSSIKAMDLIDMIAWFEVCIPDLMEKSTEGLDSITDLDLFDAVPLLKVYKEQFLPWKNSWEDVFLGLNKEEEKKEDKKEDSK